MDDAIGIFLENVFHLFVQFTQCIVERGCMQGRPPLVLLEILLCLEEVERICTVFDYDDEYFFVVDGGLVLSEVDNPFLMLGFESRLFEIRSRFVHLDLIHVRFFSRFEGH